MATPTWAPSLDQVAALMQERTQDANGVIQGTFGVTTIPTGAQVQGVLNIAGPAIYSQIPALHNADLEPLATYTAAAFLAAWVELSFWPEVSKDPESPYALLQAQATEALDRLKEQAAIEAEGGQLGTEDETPMPQFSFPEVNPEGIFGLPEYTTWGVDF